MFLAFFFVSFNVALALCLRFIFPEHDSRHMLTEFSFSHHLFVAGYEPRQLALNYNGQGVFLTQRGPHPGKSSQQLTAQHICNLQHTFTPSSCQPGYRPPPPLLGSAEIKSSPASKARLEVKNFRWKALKTFEKGGQKWQKITLPSGLLACHLKF